MAYTIDPVIVFASLTEEISNVSVWVVRRTDIGCITMSFPLRAFEPPGDGRATVESWGLFLKAPPMPKRMMIRQNAMPMVGAACCA